MRFSQHANLHREQPELDFVDIDPHHDLPLFIDPYALSCREDMWSRACTDDIMSFFQATVDAIRSSRHNRARLLLNNLSEPHETCLGLSRGRPRGHGVSGKQAYDLYQRLVQSRAVATGFLNELSDCELVIEGIGHDKISDITTNVIRRRLITYTQTQCELHGVPLRKIASGRLWDDQALMWTQEYTWLPVIGMRQIVLVPKAAVRWKPTLDHKDYYNHFVLNFLQNEALETGSQLVNVLRNGTRVVHKSDLKKIYPLSKDFLYDFSMRHPDVWEDYKTQKAVLAPQTDHIGDGDDIALARALLARLGHIGPGPAAASAFHTLIIGILEFLFYPNLIWPVKENEIHEGRKRIDISYTNAAIAGLFHRAFTNADTNAKTVIVECKNYSHDLENPELDQIAGRFSHTRGRFGLLIGRSFVDKPLFIRRCRDTAVDGRGYILPLADDDISAMLGLISDGRRGDVDFYLNQRWTMLLS